MKWLEKLTLDTVIVHTVAGPSLKGLLAGTHSDCLILREALMLEPEQQTMLNGDVIVPREQVGFLQRVSE